MQKRRKYIGKGNNELDPKINPLDRILYELDDAQKSIYLSMQKDLSEEFSQNILLGGARGSGKSSLVNLAIDFEKNLVVKIDCSIADEEADLLPLIVNELKKILDSGGIPLDDKLSQEVNRLIREVTFNATNIHKVTAWEGVQEHNEGIADFINEVCLPFKIINFRSSIRMRLKEILVSKKDKVEEVLQQRVTAYFEKKTALGEIIDIINNKIKKKLVLIFDEIDKHNIDFLDKVFDKYKSFLTSGKTTNIFLVNVSQYYHIICGNIFDNIDIYFDRKYFLRAISFSLFKNISYNEICSNPTLEINYYLNQGISRNIYADMNVENKNHSLLFKAKYYIELVEFVNDCDELDDFVKEIIVSILNKILKMGFIGNKLSLNNLQQVCSEEFSAFKNIQLEELIINILKSHVVNNENNLIIMDGDVLIVDYNMFKEMYQKDLYNTFDYQNSARYWENYKVKTEEVKERRSYYNSNYFEDLNGGQIEIRNYDDFQFVPINDSNNSHNDIIKTLLYTKVINAFIRVKKKNDLGYEFAYVFFIYSSINGRYVLYYDNASWSYEDFWVKEKIDTFIKENNIKVIEVEVDSDFKVSKSNLQLIVDKYNQHENVRKEWIVLRW